MKILGVIPARYASSRFPGKPLIDIKGKSMIQRVYEGAKQCKEIDQIVVATDDERIYKHVVDFGGEVMMTSSLHQTGTERCGEVAKKYSEVDVIINIQGDEPLVNHMQLSQLLKVFETLPETEIATLVTQVTDPSDLNNPNRIKVLLKANGEALCFSRNAIPSMLHTSNYTPLRHIGLYAYKTKCLSKLVQLPSCDWEKSESLEQLRWLYYGYTIQTVITSIETPNIDVPEDLAKVLKHL